MLRGDRRAKVHYRGAGRAVIRVDRSTQPTEATRSSGCRSGTTPLKTIFDTCRPRPDVKEGTTKDEQFAADLAQVVNETAPKEYADRAVFFRHSYPNRRMREQLKAVLTRLSGRGGEIASIIRVQTQYGGGKTHGLIALVHAVRGIKGVGSIDEFVEGSLWAGSKIPTFSDPVADCSRGASMIPAH